MTTLQEALEKIADALPAYIDGVAAREYLAVVHAALAQQVEQKPIGYVTPGYFAFGQGMIDERQDEAKCVPVYAAAPAPQQGEQQVCAGCGMPVGDVHMSTCKSGKWPSRVSNGDTAAPAPQEPQVEPTDDQLVKGVKAMRLFVTKNSVADFKLGYMAALAAAPAPAPQAQEPCPNGEPCKHGAWCTEVYCQELCEFRNQPAPQL